MSMIRGELCMSLDCMRSLSYDILSRSSDQRGMENFELLVRSLLDRPDQPAVVILGHFSPEIHAVYGFAGPDHWHNIVAQFYDVPHIRYVLPIFATKGVIVYMAPA
jgi:hypothetical protein